MTYFSDCTPCPYFNREGEDYSEALSAIGWLEPEQPFLKGLTSETVVKKLALLLEEPWQPVFVSSHQACNFCPSEIRPEFYRPTILEFDEKTLSLGRNNLFVPNQRIVYAAPSLILHYILAHQYLPPNDFQEAVMQCPPMKSPAYYKKLHERGFYSGQY